MLSELDILKDISQRLEALLVPFMLTGSMAMNYYAVPRMTRDIDLVMPCRKMRLGVSSTSLRRTT